MPTPDLVLQTPFYLIQSGTGSLLSGSSAGTGVNFGLIVLKNEISDSFEVDDTVLYVTARQTLVTYDQVEYALLREEDILYKEIPPP